MISFQLMSNENFTQYLEYFISDYAKEISVNYGLSMAQSLNQAKQEIARDLPAGVETANQVLLCILNKSFSEEIIGYIWYSVDDKTIYINDFCILPPHRRKGQSRKALSTLESLLNAEGYHEIRLRVAANNALAQHIYVTGGFRVTGINMAKRLNHSNKKN